MKDETFRWQIIFVCLNILILLSFGFYFLGIAVNDKSALLFYTVWIAMICLNTVVFFQWLTSEKEESVTKTMQPPDLLNVNLVNNAKSAEIIDTFIGGAFYSESLLKTGDVITGETLFIEEIDEKHKNFPLIGFYNSAHCLLGYVPSKEAKKIQQHLRKGGNLHAQVINSEKVCQSLSVNVRVKM